nr:reverse transcriptase domain-containing protein [Tanacetum cinerariifolium]
MFIIASRFPTPPLSCSFFSLRTTVISSSKLSRDQTSNPTSSTNPTQKENSCDYWRWGSHALGKPTAHLTPVATMTDNRTMAEMLRAPTEGCAEAIVVPPILAKQFELKRSLINMMTLEQFFGLEKDNPHDHIRCKNLTNLFVRLLRACPHHGFTELLQLDTFYNALNPSDQDSLNAAVGGNLLEKSPQDALTIIENKSKLKLRLLRKSVLPAEVLIHTTSVLPPVATLSHNSGITSKGSGSLLGNTVTNSNGKLKAITTRSGLVTDGPTVPTLPKSVTPEEDEFVKETYTDPDLTEYTIKVPPPPELANTPFNENCSSVILKKLPEKLGDPGKFLIPCGFSELKCKALADLGASINLMPLSVWKKLGLPDLIPTRMTLELANRAICTPDGIARDVFIPVGKFTFPTDFVVVDYESDPKVPLILGRPFLRTARALIDVHGEEMILHDEDERLTLNMKHNTASYSNHPNQESVNLINIFNVSSKDCLEVSVSNKQSSNPTFSLHKEITSSKVTHEIHDSEGCDFLSEELPNIDSFNDIHPHFDDDPLSGSTTYSSNSLLKEFTDELVLITYPPDYDDNLTCNIESREIGFLLYQGEDSDLKDSIDKTDLINLDDLFVDSTPEMFTDEQPPDYSFPPRFIVYPDDFLEIESDDFSRDDDLPSPDNKDKVFNPGILILKKSVTIITRVAQEKKLAISYASLVFEDFDHPFYELLVFIDVPNSMRLLLFSSENEEKVFKPGIYTSEKVHSCFLSELSHPGERKPKKEQNRIKTGQKWEAWRSREKSKAVTVNKARKTEEN